MASSQPTSSGPILDSLPNSNSQSQSNTEPSSSQPRANPSEAQAQAGPGPARQAALTKRPSHREAAQRMSRKLQRLRGDSNQPHSPTMELPDRLKDTGKEEDNEEDVLQPQGGMFMNMNQSIFGLIAAAGSTVDFHDRFEGQSSEDEDDVPNHMAMTIAGPGIKGTARNRETVGTGKSLSQIVVFNKPPASATADAGPSNTHRRRLSGHKLLQSVPGLSRLSSSHKSKKSKQHKGTAMADNKIEEEEDPDPSSPLPPPNEDENKAPGLAPPIEIVRAEGNGAPLMSRMLEARAEMAARPSFDLDRLSGEHRRDDAGGTGQLAKKLKDIFEFDTAEEVIEEYPCWLLQHVLLQGYMYITANHIAFYAHLPKKAHEIAKSGYLSKSGKRNPKYNRYWFRLKGDILSYYQDPKDHYFPAGQIDLRYGISASVNDKEKEGNYFSVTTHHRTYHFKADSAQSAKEWVKSLQRVIFRSHNDGDSVKISIPIKNILDIEETQMVEFADTCKIRVIDNDETYAIDEYFFSFFSFGKKAIQVLKVLVEDSSPEDSGANDAPKGMGGDGANGDNLGSPPTRTFTEGVKATLSPVSPIQIASPSSRASGDYFRSSFDATRPFSRRSFDASPGTAGYPGSPPRSLHGDGRRSFSKPRHEPHASTDSYAQSFDDPSQASLSALVTSGSSEDQSASQILRGSDVFHSPIFRRSASATRAATEGEGVAAPPIVRQHTAGLVRLQGLHHAATTGQIGDHTAEAEGGPSTPTLQSIATMGNYPLQRANAFMGYLDRQSRRMSNLLATESMGYVEKVSGMWKGGKKHYDQPALGRTEEEDVEDDPEERALSEARFQAHFALPETERLQAAYFGFIVRVLPLYGKIYISNRHFCFRSLLPGTRTKLILPLKDIETVDKEKGFRFGYSGLVVVIRGHEEIFFEFAKAENRDDCAITIIQSLDAARYLAESQEAEEAQAAEAERDALNQARNEEFPDHEIELPRQASGVSDAPTILFDDPKASFLNFKPSEPMRITCLTIGSRGDVQPYIALCKRLLEEGHHPKIVTHREFKDWIESHGIEFGPVEGDPSELMRICIENGTFTYAFLREANSKFRGWLDELLTSAWEACQGSDLLIESPSAMAGIHIAEALGIPYFRAFTMPWTRTRAYPHAFIMPGQKMGGAYNYITYVMFDNVFWKATAHQVNRWRNKYLGLPNTSLEKLQPNKVPFLYNFSPSVVPPPIDYSDWIRVTGYWFLDEGGDKWQPPKELTDFIAKARADEKKLVYIGFGSIIVSDPAKMTQEIIDAVLRADVRCILSKGWSDRSAAVDGVEKPNVADPTLPPEIIQIQSAPHDWLFQQVDAAAHHGGSGTTGASLRAGIPTIIRPFFGDQFFFAGRVEDLGVGIYLKKWGVQSFARALWEATHSSRMQTRAEVLGGQIRAENGVDTAIQAIYRDLDYARNLITLKRQKHQSRRNSVATPTPGAKPNAPADDQDQEAEEDDIDADDEEEESWTFVGGNEDDMTGSMSMSRSDLLSQTVANLRGVKVGKEPTLGSRVLSPPPTSPGAKRGTGGVKYV
ncbi:sterol 3-beta-glucosyltransferase [Neurospora tetraspora]|uniref:Sterol 3-beta-glucosyltransferase n=1 Tax=Neurospora tetraspora TaxID=94610 RepID=A0AAE0JGZ7_9PEZI|nr:sterol 3-beta-glucosyltransferase [Neurospora tetraspora]